MFPNIPVELIQRDLNLTHSVEITIENILDDRVIASNGPNGGGANGATNAANRGGGTNFFNDDSDDGPDDEDDEENTTTDDDFNQNDHNMRQRSNLLK